MKALSKLNMLNGTVFKNITRRLVPALLILGGFTALIGVEKAKADPPPTPPVPPVDVKVYSGFTTIGGGAPYSGLIGELHTLDIKFATNFSYNWHPFGQFQFGADLTGFLFVSAAGSKSFTLNSDDGSELFIDGSLVVNDGGPHGPNTVTSSATLTAGTHTFEVKFFECCGGPSGVDLTLPVDVKYGFAGTPGNENCKKESVESLAHQFHGINNAAAKLGFSKVKALKAAIKAYCGRENDDD